MLIVEIKERDHKSCDREADECLKGIFPKYLADLKTNTRTKYFTKGN